MVAEVAEGVLRSHSGADRRREFDALVAIVLSVFDRYPVPASLESRSGASCASIWSAASSLSACIRPSALWIFLSRLPNSISTCCQFMKSCAGGTFHHAQLSQGDAVQHP